MKRMNYKISLDYDDYFSNSLNLTASNIEVIGDAILFQTDNESIKYLDSNNIRYMLHYSKKGQVKYFLKHRVGIIVGVLVVCFLVFFNSFRVSEIKFNSEYPINSEIEAYIKSQNQDMLFFSFHKNNYDFLSKELRSMYVEYEWININKKGSSIYVDIIQNQDFKPLYEDDFSADIIAGKSGLITEYSVFNGDVNVEIGDYVNKGDILIKGDLTGVKCAKGYIIATTYETIVVDVKKNEIKEELSGNNTEYYDVSLFSKSFNINKKKTFAKSDSNKVNIFTIPYLFSINKIEEYEKNDIIYTNDKQNSLIYAKSVVEDNFNNQKILDMEEILRIEVLSIIEDEEYFHVKLLVKKKESIGELKKHL